MSATWSCDLCNVKNDMQLVKCSFCEAQCPFITHEEAAKVEAPSKKRKEPTPEPPAASSRNPAHTWQCRTCLLLNPFSLALCGGCTSPRFRGNLTSSNGNSLAPPIDSTETSAKRQKLEELGTSLTIVLTILLCPCEALEGSKRWQTIF